MREKLERLWYHFGKDVMKLGLTGLFLCLVFNGGRKYERGRPVKYFYPKIAEVRVNENILLIDNKYRLDYDPNLSTDPNTIIFTSYKYKQNNEK